MVSRGFRHAHAYLREPKFRRWQVAQGHDVLPWADPYIVSLFQSDEEDESSDTDAANESVSFDDDEEAPPWRR